MAPAARGGPEGEPRRGICVEPRGIDDQLGLPRGQQPRGQRAANSLVQRDLVWTETQVRYLLDSLLFGYPIGSLLLCRVSHDGAVLERRDGVRHAVAASADDWQLLDGQQRVTALVRLFTPPTALRS